MYLNSRFLPEATWLPERVEKSISQLLMTRSNGQSQEMLSIPSSLS